MALTLSSCGSLPLGAITSALGGSSSNDGVQVGTEDITIGQKKEDNDVNVTLGGGADTQQAQVIENNNGLNPFTLLLLVLLAGWAIPSPLEMFRGIRKGWLALRGKA